jgi:ATP-dependent Clp protease protease subunit
MVLIGGIVSKEKKVDRSNPSVEECGIYLLMDEITDTSCKEVISFIISKNLTKPYPKYLQLVINSPGGDLNSAFAVIDTIKGSAIPIYTVGLGCIASAAVLIFMAGEKGKRILTPNTSILSHQYSWGTYGKEHDLFATVKEYELTTQRMLTHYKKCTGLTEKKIREFLLPAEDVWLSANQAKKLGLCDSVKTVY